MRHVAYAYAYATATALVYPIAHAQDYPAKPVRLVVPVAPGGGNDILARLLARKMTEQFGQQIVIENRPGAGTVIGSDHVAKSPPDGYTLLMQINALAANHTLVAKLPYDTLKDFTPVVLVASTPNVLVVHPSLPARSVKAFIALARAQPNQIAYASTGNGGAAFLATEMLKLNTGIQILHVAYKGTAPALSAMLSGEAQCMVASLPGTIAFIQTGRVRALGVTSPTRAPTVPDVPTMIEAGVRGYEFATWYGLFAPGRTPREVIGKLNTTVNRILGKPDFREQLTRGGLDAAGGSAESFDSNFRREVAKLREVIRATGVRVE